MCTKKRAGMTLVEVLLAMAVLALIAAPLLALFHTGLETTALSRRKQLAASTARLTLEELRGLDYAALSSAVAIKSEKTPDEGSTGLYLQTVMVPERAGALGLEDTYRVTVLVFGRAEDTDPLFTLEGVLYAPKR